MENRTTRECNLKCRRTEMKTQEKRKIGIIEGSEENSIRLCPELVDESIKASLETLHAQISSLTETMDRLIQSNLTTESTTATSRGPGLQFESPYSEGPGSSKFPTVALLTTAGCSPHSWWSVFDQIS